MELSSCWVDDIVATVGGVVVILGGGDEMLMIDSSPWVYGSVKFPDCICSNIYNGH